MAVSRYRIEERGGWFVVVDTAYPRASAIAERGRYTTKGEAMQRAADLVRLDAEE